MVIVDQRRDGCADDHHEKKRQELRVPVVEVTNAASYDCVGGGVSPARTPDAFPPGSPSWPDAPSIQLDGDNQAGEWDFLDDFRSLSKPVGDASSTLAVANHVVAEPYSISQRKRLLALGSIPIDQNESSELEAAEMEELASMRREHDRQTLNQLIEAEKLAATKLPSQSQTSGSSSKSK
ncbi:hypothetical protein AAE478_008133 [Parahypoxylon ruwenzoriense]